MPRKNIFAFLTTITNNPKLLADLEKSANILTAANTSELYDLMVSKWRNPSVLTGTRNDGIECHMMNLSKVNSLNDAEKIMALDLKYYLTDDILVKVDRAAMQYSLETRVPFLDHRLVEFALKIPFELKIRRKSKWILREVLKKRVPENLFNRPKMGFGVPMDVWLKGSLREWASDMLSMEKVKSEGILNPSIVQKTWTDFVGGSSTNSEKVWNLLMFQVWNDSFSKIKKA